MMHRTNQLRILLIIAILFCGLSINLAQDLKPIKLLPPQTEIGKPLMQVLKLRSSSRNFDSKPLPIQELSNLLWAAYGINRPESGKRTAPSARNWQEVDVYVTMAEGVFIYDAKSHSLNPVVAGDLRAMTGTQAYVKDAPINLVFVADNSRISSGNDAEETKNNFSAADVGFIAQNVYLYCASQGLAVVVRGLIDRSKLAEVLKLRPEQRIILSQTVGYPK